MNKQLDLIEHMERKIPVVDPHVEPADKPRLRGNSAAVLARLQQGPATNLQLMQVGGIRFGARIHDLKKHGYTISSEHDAGGLWLYTLESE